MGFYFRKRATKCVYGFGVDFAKREGLTIEQMFVEGCVWYFWKNSMFVYYADL
jgi:hypothetical protein